MTSPNFQFEGNNNVKKGLVLVHTGDGKGKTTAGMGLIFRALGHGLRVCVIQFLKHEGGQWGEVDTARRLNVEWYKEGDGFTWTSQNMDDTRARAVQGWALSREKISSGQYDLILLDEFTYPLFLGWLNIHDVLNWLKTNKPDNLHLVITGRYAPKALVEYADLVTEMKLVKHPFNQGIPGQIGIEF